LRCLLDHSDHANIFNLTAVEIRLARRINRGYMKREAFIVKEN
jgi:hypothetical protein